MMAGELRSLVWVDRLGRETPVNAPDRPYYSVALLPDDTRIAVTIDDGQYDIYTMEASRPTLTPVVVAGRDALPIWTPDGQELVFQSDRDGRSNLYRQRADGTAAAVRLPPSENTLIPGSDRPRRPDLR